MLIPTAALLLAPLVAPAQGWRLEGKAQLYGVEQPFEFVTDGQLRFRSSVHGSLPDVNGFDGSHSWTLNHSGVTHFEGRQGRDVDRLVAWVLDGEWAQPDSPVAQTQKADGSITLTCKDSDALRASLTLDPTSKEPASLSYWEPDGTTTWTFSKYKAFGNKSFPTRIDFAVGKQRYWYNIASATQFTPSNTEFQMPLPDVTDTTFDSSAAPKVEVKHIFGYFFVHPLVDGQDVGWFFLDTGAGAMVLDAAAATKLGVTKIGNTVAAGVVATVDTPISRAKLFRLGPVSIANPTFLELDLTAIGRVFKLQLGGICGYDFLARVGLDIDARTPSISVYPPGKAVLPSAAFWTQFEFTGNLMCLKCHYEGGHDGIFTIDTGSGSTVDFMSPTVEKFDLLTDRQTLTVQVGGAGGAAAGKTGKLDWFEIAGNRVSGLNVGFELTKTGVYASPYLIGNIGAGHPKVASTSSLDYRNQRLSLAPYPASQ